MRTLEYGKPRPLSDEDLRTLRKWDERIWKRSMDRFNFVHAFPEGKLTKTEREWILDLIGEHVLPCVLHSGPYGELSFAVFDHSSLPGIHPEQVISLSEEHFGLRGTFKDWQKRFDALSKVTHSPRNREVLTFYKFPEPGPASDYDY